MRAESAPTLDDVLIARQRIAGVVTRTPLERSDALSADAGSDVFLKLECWQRTRSFKLRGAYNALAALSAAERARGLVTASAGNHGQAVALAARELGARATIFVPADAPAMKKDRIRRLGAELRDDAPDYDAAEAAAAAEAKRSGRVFVHAFSAAAVVAGQGTIALELLEDLPALHQVVVPVGGGGLISGIGLVLRRLAPRVKVIGVQSVETRAVYEALRAGRLVDVPVTPTLADGLAGCTDAVSVARVQANVDDVVLVEESAIADAIAVLYARDGVVAEGSGAVGVAAIRSGAVRVDGPTALVVSGGNIDGGRLADILSTR
ncbi:MAG TPA: threonine/serine dehydratase [Longimicrobiales bacterium]|nr:threonine/serine dehydratase [Longimicrobiales bacterium]